MRRMRQSTLGSFDICPRRAQLSILPHPYSTSVAAAVGTAYHAGLEHLFGTVGETGEIDWPGTQVEALSSLNAEVARAEDRMSWGDDTHETAADRVLELLRYYKDSGRFTQLIGAHDIVATELEFDVPWRETWSQSGTIDLVLRGRDSGEIVLIDHKTTGRKWWASKSTFKQLPQAAWYLHAYEQATEERPVMFVFDVMTYKGELDIRPLIRNPKLEQSIMDRFDTAATVMDLFDETGMDWPTNPSSVLCSEKYCDHWERCPMGAEAERSHLTVIPNPKETT
jgi:hypothetical protein